MDRFDLSERRLREVTSSLRGALLLSLPRSRAPAAATAHWPSFSTGGQLSLDALSSLLGFDRKG